MKLPRWLVVTMLATSCLAMVTFAAWRWVTWPEHTANHFVELMMTNKRGEAAGLMQTHEALMLQAQRAAPPGFLPDYDDSNPPSWTPRKLWPQPRSLTDIMSGSQSFSIVENL